MKKTTLKLSFLSLIVTGLFAFTLISCGGGDKKKDKKDTTKTDTTVKAPVAKGDLAGAKAIAAEFLKKGADCMALTKKLVPNLDDCKAYLAKEEDAQKVFDYLQEAVKKMEKDNKPIAPRAEQDDYLMYSATTDQLKEKEWKGDLGKFPTPYHELAPLLKPGITIYMFKFVKKGDDKGIRNDGLVFLNNHWVMFPKIFKAFKDMVPTAKHKKK
jgi:hypothetical protein